MVNIDESNLHSYVDTDSSRTLLLSLNNAYNIQISDTGSIRITAQLHKDDVGEVEYSINPARNSGGIMNDMGLENLNVNVEGESVIVKFNTIDGVIFDPKKLKVLIFDNSGKMIKDCSSEIIENESNRFLINSKIVNETLAKGIYFLRVEYEDKALYYRFYIGQ